MRLENLEFKRVSRMQIVGRKGIGKGGELPVEAPDSLNLTLVKFIDVISCGGEGPVGWTELSLLW